MIGSGMDRVDLPPAPPEDDDGSGGGDELTLLRAWLYPFALDALERATVIEQLLRPSDNPGNQAVNRALQLYAQVNEWMAAGDRFERVTAAGVRYDVTMD